MGRVFRGTVSSLFTLEYNDGLPPEVRVASEDMRYPGVMEFPLSWFIDAGYEADAVQVGLKFGAETPADYGVVPRTWTRILPPNGEEQ